MVNMTGGRRASHLDWEDWWQGSAEGEVRLGGPSYNGGRTRWSRGQLDIVHTAVAWAFVDPSRPAAKADDRASINPAAFRSETAHAAAAAVDIRACTGTGKNWLRPRRPRAVRFFTPLTAPLAVSVIADVWHWTFDIGEGAAMRDGDWVVPGKGHFAGLMTREPSYTCGT